MFTGKLGCLLDFIGLFTGNGNCLLDLTVVFTGNTECVYWKTWMFTGFHRFVYWKTVSFTGNGKNVYWKTPMFTGFHRFVYWKWELFTGFDSSVYWEHRVCLLENGLSEARKQPCAGPFYYLPRLRAQRTAWAMVSSSNPCFLNLFRAFTRTLDTLLFFFAFIAIKHLIYLSGGRTLQPLSSAVLGLGFGQKGFRRDMKILIKASHHVH